MPNLPRHELAASVRTPLAGAVRLALALAVTWAAAGCDSAPRELTLAERAEPGAVFILGFDGLAPNLVERWESQGLLPAFARLRTGGAAGRVRSTIPMISPPAWTSVSTGTTPGDHGIWSFWVPQGDDPRGRFVDARSRLAPAIWEELTAMGRSVGVINVPIVSGTSLDADSVEALTDPEDIRHAFWLARQEILFLEGRRVHDLGIRMPVMQREIDTNPNITEGDPGTVAVVPDWIPSGDEMDLFTPTTLYEGGLLDDTQTLMGTQVTMNVDMNKLLVQNRKSLF